MTSAQDFSIFATNLIVNSRRFRKNDLIKSARILELVEKIRELDQREKKEIYHNNALAQKSVLTIPKINQFKYELLVHPPYSPDLAPSDYSLFPNLKTFLAFNCYSRKLSDTPRIVIRLSGPNLPFIMTCIIWVYFTFCKVGPLSTKKVVYL